MLHHGQYENSVYDSFCPEKQTSIAVPLHPAEERERKEKKRSGHQNGRFTRDIRVVLVVRILKIGGGWI